MRLERLSPLVKGILLASSSVEEFLSPEVIKYSVTHEVSDEIQWDCGALQLRTPKTAPSKLKEALHLDAIDKDTLSLWTSLEIIPSDEIKDDAHNHQKYLLARVFDSIPPGIFVIPDHLPGKIIAEELQDLVRDISDRAVSKKGEGEIDPIELQKKDMLKDETPRLGRRPLRDDEDDLERVREVLTEYNRLRKENLTRSKKDIEKEINKRYEVAPRTLRKWRKDYKDVLEQ